MSSPGNPPTTIASPISPAGHEATAQGQSWIPYVLPLALYMLLGTVEPRPSTPAGAEGMIPYHFYPAVYTVKLVATTLACAWSLRAWKRDFPLRVQAGSLVVGAAGTVLWVAVCALGLEETLLQAAGWQSLGERAAYDPFTQLGHNSVAAGGFFAVRLFGLAVVVPLCEEFFLRALLMRYVMHPNWWAVPFGTVNAAAVITGTVIPMLSHPGEFLAAALWFSGMTWWMVRTRNIWDCVMAHGVTNLLLGLYVLLSGNWHLV